MLMAASVAIRISRSCRFPWMSGDLMACLFWIVYINRTYWNQAHLIGFDLVCPPGFHVFWPALPWSEAYIQFSHVSYSVKKPICVVAGALKYLVEVQAALKPCKSGGTASLGGTHHQPIKIDETQSITQYPGLSWLGTITHVCQDTLWTKKHETLRQIVYFSR